MDVLSQGKEVYRWYIFWDREPVIWVRVNARIFQMLKYNRCNRIIRLASPLYDVSFTAMKGSKLLQRFRLAPSGPVFDSQSERLEELKKSF